MIARIAEMEPVSPKIRTPKAAPKTRRHRGDGSVHRRKDGLWTAVIPLGVDERGRRKRRQIYGQTEAIVIAKRKVIEHEIASCGSAANSSRKTVASFFTDWLEEVVKPDLRATTLRSYKGIVDGHIAGPHGIAHLKLRDVAPSSITALYVRLRRYGVGDRTLQLTHAVLHRGFRHALRQELIVRNPIGLVDAPSYRASETHPLTNAQIKRLLATAQGDRLEALYALAVLSGARQGELFALQWRDLDLHSRTMHIRRSQQDVSGVLTVAETKTDASRRLVHLPRIAVDALRDHRKRMAIENLGTGPSELVFTAPEGGPLRRTNMLLRSFKPLLERAGLPDIRFHDLRHSYATALLTSNTHPKIVQEQLGHTKISTTLNVYSHVIPTMAKSAVCTLDVVFGARKKKLER